MTHIMVDLEELRYHIGENPFVSERTLRKAGVVTTKPTKSNEPVVEPPVPKVYTTVAGGGYFDSENGFELCNPRIGSAFYFYNHEHPPPFDTGTMEIEIIIPPEPVFTNVIHGLAPPPLPSLAALSKMESAAKKPVIVIKKLDKPAAEAPAPTGWNAIMAEMERRKNGMLKKVEAPPPKPAAAPKATVKKNKKDFKDIMEELAYKLAKMRGDVVEDDGDDSPTDTKPDGGKVQFDSAAGGEAKPEATPTTGLRKLNSKPDLSSLLAKIKPAAALTPAKGAPPSSAAAAPPAALDGQILGTPALTAAPASVPYPPLLPTGDTWPPVPTVPPPEAPKVEPPPPPAPEVVEKQLVSLPAGYYMPEVQKGSVKPGKYVYGGVITQALFDSLIKEIPPKKKKPPKKVHIVSAPAHHVNKLTMDDLPVPTDFQSSINRLRRSQDLREERNRLEREKELRPYLTVGNKPVEAPVQPVTAATTTTTTTTPKKVSSSSSMGGGGVTPTQPKGFHSNVDKRVEGKNFTFRQSDVTPGGASAAGGGVGFKSPAGGQGAVRKDFSRQDPLVNWVSNLRFESVAAPSPAGKGGVKSSSSRGHNTGGGGQGSGNEKENRRGDQSSTMLDDNDDDMNSVEYDMEGEERDEIHSTGFDSVGISYTTTSESQVYMSDTGGGGAAGGGGGRAPIIPQGPKLRIDDVVSRRQSLHASRLRDEQLRQQYEDERVRIIKARLKNKAMQAALEAGVYKPTTRYHQHQKMIEKYSHRSDSGINLEDLTRRSFQEYSSHHMSSAEERRRGGGSSRNGSHSASPANVGTEFFMPTDLDFYYRERPNQQYSF